MKYDIIEQIGKGSFGEVYLGKNKRSGEHVAIKCENKESKSKMLKNETRIYRELKGGKGIANVRWYGVHENQTYAVLDLLGKSLDDYKAMHETFTLKTILLIGIQLLYRMEFIHGKGFIHRDIKPENFMFGRTGKTIGILHVIDFGLSKSFVVNGRHIALKDGKRMIGTPRYASLNVHDGYEPSRRDDLISIGYMLIYLHNGNLPWQGLKGKNKQDKYDKIANLKRDISIEKLCEGLPKEFVSYIEYCYELDFEEKPNYELLRRIFKRVLKKYNMINDHIFDWS